MVRSRQLFAYFILICILVFIRNAGKVTSLVTKKDLDLATRIEEAMKKNESLEALTTSNVRRVAANPHHASNRGRTSRLVKSSSAPKAANLKGKKGITLSSKSSRISKDTSSSRKHSSTKSMSKPKSAAAGKVKPVRSANKSSVKVAKSRAKPEGRKGDALNKIGTKLSVVGFRGRSSGKSAQAS